MRRIGRLHVLTHTLLQDRFSHEELARRAIAGGADTIQLRQKRGTTGELIGLARAVNEICRPAGVPLLVHDRVDVALAADAAGVHLGRMDFPISLARRLLGPDRVIGGSATNLTEAQEAAAAGADYISLGAIFAKPGKPEDPPRIGLEGLAAVIPGLDIPVIACGGVDESRIADLLGTGVHGVAVLQAVVLTADPQRAAARLRTAIDAALAEGVR